MRVSEYPNVLESTDGGETPVPQPPGRAQRHHREARRRRCLSAGGEKRRRLSSAGFRACAGHAARPAHLDPSVAARRQPELEADDAKYQERGLYSVGAQLQRKELLDPSIVWEPQQAGEYRLGLADMRSLGGPTSVYRIEVEPVRDSVFTYPYSRVIDTVECPRLTNFVIPQGNRWTVNIGLAEGQGNRYRGELELVARGLPPGVQMIAPRVQAGQTIVPVQLVAAANTPPQVALFELLARPVDTSRELESGSQQAFPFLGHSGGAAWRSVVVDRYALAVTEPAPFSIELVPPQIPLALNGELALEVKVTRQRGFNEPIEIQADWAPPGVNTKPTVTIEACSSRAVYRLSATGSAKPATWRFAVTATTTGGSYYLGVGRIRVSSAFIDLAIAEPYLALKNHPASIRRGQRAQIVWDVDHKKPLGGETEAVLLGLPKGVSVVEPVPRLNAGDKQLVFDFVASDDVLLGQYKELTCEIIVRQAGQEIRQRTGKGILRVDPPLVLRNRKTKP